MTDLVWLHGPEYRGHSEELRWSLRSVAANLLLPSGRVFVVGHAPRWLDRDRAVFVRVPAGDDDKHAATRRSMLAACHAEGLSDNFVYLNDDFFAVRPAAVPIWHRGPVAEMTGRDGPWYDQLRAVAEWLRARGVDRPLNYELHVPLMVNKFLMAGLLEADPLLPCKRSAYANLAQVGGVLHPDVKIRDSNGRIPADAAWVSSSDTSFHFGAVGQQLRGLFPDPSPFEIDATPGTRRLRREARQLAVPNSRPEGALTE